MDRINRNETTEVINPATEEVIGTISLGTKEDLDKAVKAARAAFPSFSKTSRNERVKMLENIVRGYEKRKDELIEVMTQGLCTAESIRRGSLQNGI